MIDNDRSPQGKLALTLCLLLCSIALAVLTWMLFQPVVQSSVAAVETPEENKLKLPEYDYTRWHALPVQTGGRVMPLESACIDAVRQVTGRAKFEKNDPVAVVLSWMMYRPGAKSNPDWENYPFILCDHHGLRELIFSPDDLLKGQKEGPTEQQLHGKYLTPNQVRNSKSIERLAFRSNVKRMADPDKGHHNLDPLEAKADEVLRRLTTFESIIPTESVPLKPGRRRDPTVDPFRFVILDRVHGGAWLSLGLLRECAASPQPWFTYWSSGLQDRDAIDNSQAWHELMKQNLARMPHLYLDPALMNNLATFQAHIQAGTEAKALQDLQTQLDSQSQSQLEMLKQLYDTGDARHAVEYMFKLVGEDDELDRLRKLVQSMKAKYQEPDPTSKVIEEIIQRKALTPILHDKNKRFVAELQRRIDQAQASGYHPEDDRHRDLHMTYLEAQVPDIYRKSVAWQPFPIEDSQKVLAAFDAAQNAYASGDKEQFLTASNAFMDTVKNVSTEYDSTYPIISTLDLEMDHNRIEPFRWAWISMLVSVLMLSLFMGTGSRWLYWGSMLPMAVSLGFQGFAYYTRWMISGRPPVTNMYETLVFVSTMSVVFALILEMVYRKGHILLAGALVGTIGLVLADQLPTGPGFDPRISPLTPVLRSNFWLLIHVLTIVASYAAGTLAWGLGNLMLGMYLLGSRRTDQLKMMANFCYKAMQIAVLLLAAGTFLGGWWAAESWGRFWGWDPKETFALIALIVYVIPLHMRFVGWIKDFGMAVAAVLCYASIFMSWYGVNFILPAGLHSYGFGGGGTMWAFWAGTLNLEFLFLVWLVHVNRRSAAGAIADSAQHHDLVSQPQEAVNV